MKIPPFFALARICFLTIALTPFAHSDPLPVASASPSPAEPTEPAAPSPPATVDLTTLDGATYAQAIITDRTPLTITISYADGIARLPFSRLTPASQKIAGYDAGKAAIASRAAQAAQAQSLAAAQKEAQANAAANAETQAIRARLRKQAAKHLMNASIEDQVRAALAAKLLQQRKGRPLSPQEYQVLDDDTRFCITFYYPDLMPDALLPEN